MRALAIAVAVLGVAVCVALWGAGRFLVVADPLPSSADAIVVLAGSTADRALETAELYRAGVAPRVVVTREQRPRGDWRLRARGVALPESDALMRRALVELGVPESAIVTLRRRAASTATEARTIARWACRRGVHRLVVVTSKAHTRRARLILERSLGPTVAVTIRPSRYDDFTARRWWHVRRDAKIVLNEWQRLAHHWLRERWRIEPCGGLRPRPEPC